MVETLRKPSTGLKPGLAYLARDEIEVETLRKPSTGLKRLGGVGGSTGMVSRHSENPARD